MPAVWEQDQHDFMNVRRFPFKWLKIKPLVNVVPSPSLLYLSPFLIEDGHEVTYMEGLFYSLEKMIAKISEINPEIIYKAYILRAHIVEIPAHLDWSFQNKNASRISGIRIARGILSGLMACFIFRPYRIW